MRYLVALAFVGSLLWSSMVSAQQTTQLDHDYDAQVLMDCYGWIANIENMQQRAGTAHPHTDPVVCKAVARRRISPPPPVSNAAIEAGSKVGMTPALVRALSAAGTDLPAWIAAEKAAAGR